MSSAPDNKSNKSHFAVIAVIMLVVLLLSTGAAWLLVARRGQAAETGSAIVQTIRERTLGSFWPRPRVQWYLRSEDDQPSGWHLSIIRPSGNFYHGLEISYILTPSGPRVTWERWQLTNDISAGAYRAGIYRPDTNAQIVDTTIDYKDGQVTVQQGRELTYSQSPAPLNYLPEGTLHLACLLAGKQGGKAYFKLVFNEKPPIGERIDFGTIAAKPVDLGPYRIEAAQTGASVQAWVGKRQDTVLLFDKSDQLIATVLSGQGIREMAATQQQVAKSFPGADQVAGYLSHLLKLPLIPGPAPRPPRIEPTPEGQEETRLEAD